MGQKVNPVGMRLGIIGSWNSKWYEKKQYADYLIEDLKIRSFLKKKLSKADLGKVEIIRYPERININILTGRPGLIIGKKGSDIEILKKELMRISSKKIHVNIIELRNTSLNANLVSAQIARQIEGRASHKRVMKQAIHNTVKAGAKGIKVLVSGRLGGAEMARKELYKEGRIPLHTFRANIDYGYNESLTKFGKIGVKVWIFKGEELSKKR